MCILSNRCRSPVRCRPVRNAEIVESGDSSDSSRPAAGDHPYVWRAIGAVEATNDLGCASISQNVR
jgi:hypothetical protein